MNSIKNLKRIHRIHKLIQSECTGTPLELSNRFNISERLVYHLIEQLKYFDLEVDICVKVLNHEKITHLLV